MKIIIQTWISFLNILTHILKSMINDNLDKYDVKDWNTKPENHWKNWGGEDD